jgi:hypothetical protein
VDCPVEITTVPLVPLLVVPVLNTNPPLTPLVPALGVSTIKGPLLVSELEPEEMVIAPPVTAAVADPEEITMLPPGYAVPDPTFTKTEPPKPEVAERVAMSKDPEEPELEVPDLNKIAPLTPNVPALADIKLIAPLDVADPEPETSEIAPPVKPELSPVVTRTLPPFSDPTPTFATMFPPFPLVADPVASMKVPEDPELDVPVLNIIAPLTPPLPELTEFKLIPPLELTDPSPAEILTAPPVKSPKPA